MRVTFALSYEKMVGNIGGKKEDLDRLTSMLASGKRLLRPEDDPAAWSQAMGIKENLREFETFGRNIDFAYGWNQATDSALSSLTDLLIQAKDTAIKAVGINSSEERNAQVKELEQLSEQVLSLANSQYGDQYIFSGRNTSTAPFQKGDFNYYGNTQPLEVRVGKNTRQTVNLDGQTAFFTSQADPNSNILKTLDDLKNAIQAGNTDQVQTIQSALDTAQQHISAMSSSVGSRLKGLEHQSNVLGSIKIDHQGRLSDVQDADMTEVIMQIQMKRTSFEAALQVTTLLNDLNLTKFL